MNAYRQKVVGALRFLFLQQMSINTRWDGDLTGLSKAHLK
jgi:hypothetical protein